MKKADLAARVGLLLGLLLTGCTTSQPTSIAYTATPITIDGQLDDPAWQLSKTLATIRGENGADVMVLRAAWDDHYLYLGYELLDRNLQAGPAEAQPEGPPGHERRPCAMRANGQLLDLIEFLFTFDDPHFMWEIHHNATNQFTDLWACAAHPRWPVAQSTMVSTSGVMMSPRQFIAGRDDREVQHATALMPRADGTLSTANQDADRDVGYTGELRLPWWGIATPKSCRVRVPAQMPVGSTVMRTSRWDLHGRTIHLLTVVQLNEGNPRYLTSSVTLSHDMPFHGQISRWPRYSFGGRP